jgi:biopolymer transport protein ExbB
VFNILIAAGWPAYPLILASIIVLALIIERFIALRRERVLPASLYDESVEALKNKSITPDMIVNLAQHSPLGKLLSSALRQHITQKNLNYEMLETEMEKAGRGIAHTLEKYMTTIGSIASVAPLMGLFGTVIGMIELFAAGGATNTEQMSKGISIALYNTALGLIIAIPALIFWRHFRRQIDAYLLELEQVSSRFCHMLLSNRKIDEANINNANASANANQSKLKQKSASASLKTIVENTDEDKATKKDISNKDDSDDIAQEEQNIKEIMEIKAKLSKLQAQTKSKGE